MSILLSKVYLSNDVDEVKDFAEEELESVDGVSAAMKSPVLNDVVDLIGLLIRADDRFLDTIKILFLYNDGKIMFNEKVTVKRKTILLMNGNLRKTKTISNFFFAIFLNIIFQTNHHPKQILLHKNFGPKST